MFLIQEYGLHTESLVHFQPFLNGLISVIVIAGNSFKFKKRSQLFSACTTKRLSYRVSVGGLTRLGERNNFIQSRFEPAQGLFNSRYRLALAIRLLAHHHGTKKPKIKANPLMLCGDVLTINRHSLCTSNDSFNAHIENIKSVSNAPLKMKPAT